MTAVETEIDEIDILWHYCSNEAFLSIISSQEIWLGEITHSNDYMEGKWLIEEILRPALLNSGLADYQVIQVLGRIYDMKGRYNAFAFCLSEKSDVLSQWRGYADDGRGVAIGFNKKYLETLIGNGPNLLSKINTKKKNS